MPTSLLAVMRAPREILRGLLANDKAHSHTLCYVGSQCLQPFSSITFQPFALNVNTHTCTACQWGVQSPHKPVQRRHDDGTAGAADGSTGRLPPPVTERTREGIRDWAGPVLCMHDFKASCFPLPAEMNVTSYSGSKWHNCSQKHYMSARLHTTWTFEQCRQQAATA